MESKELHIDPVMTAANKLHEMLSEWLFPDEPSIVTFLCAYVQSDEDFTRLTNAFAERCPIIQPGQYHHHGFYDLDLNDWLLEELSSNGISKINESLKAIGVQSIVERKPKKKWYQITWEFLSLITTGFGIIIFSYLLFIIGLIALGIILMFNSTPSGIILILIGAALLTSDIQEIQKNK